MARMPGARWVGPHHDNGRMIRFDILCVHTIVGYAPAHAAHFSVYGSGFKDQSRDTAYRSAANADGNYRIIAVECEDHGPHFPEWSGSNVPELTDKQIESIAEICAWAYKTHGIPLVACPNSKPGSRGIAYHRQGIDGNFGSYDYGGRVAGGEVWTKHYGKVCPGDRRISQIPQIIKRARVLAGLEEDDMQLSDRVKLTDKQSEYFNGLESISVKGLLVYGAMGGWKGPGVAEDVDDILREVLEAEKRDLEA
jgi:hypothetical protein